MHHDDFEAPRIYVACLSSYNKGELHGEWLEAAQSVDDIRRGISEMLASSPSSSAEEWAVHDHEGFWPLHVPEHPDLEQLADAAELISERRSVAAHLLSLLGGVGQVNEARNWFHERYVGGWSSLSDWVEHLVDVGTFGEIENVLRPYIDVASLGRDLRLQGEIEALDAEGQMHIFWNT